MEIKRKTYSKIIGAIKEKEVSADNAIDLADIICEIIEEEVENITTINTVSTIPPKVIPRPNKSYGITENGKLMPDLMNPNMV